MNQPPGGFRPGNGYPGQPQAGYPAAQPQPQQPALAQTVAMPMAPGAFPGVPQAAAIPQGYAQPQAQQPYAQPQAQQPIAQPQPMAQPQGAPVAQPGAPQGQPQQNGVMGQFNMNFNGGGVGMPRIGFQGASFSKGALLQKVMSGQGFENPRKMGAIFLGLFVAFCGGNFLLVKLLHRFYPYLYSLAAICFFAGLFMLVTGQPKTGTGPDGKAPKWASMGLGAALLLGIGAGVFLVVVHWEAWVPFLAGL